LVIKLVVKSEFIGLKTWKSKTSDNWYTEGKYSAYIVISYNKFNKDDKSKNVNESVYFSVPHMYSLKSAFSKIAQRLDSPKYEKEIFDELDDKEHGFLLAVSEKYANYGTKAWGAEKNIVLSFDVYENEAKNTIDKGVRINIITEGTSVFVPTDIFMSIDLLIQEFNLQTNSLLLFNSYLCSKAAKSSSAGRKAVTEQEE
jgi:hypothetical protein